MKIGDLFVSLGFKVDGNDQMEEAERRVSNLAGKAGKLALFVNALNLAFLAMVDSAAKAGQVMENFALSTGLSTDDLQLWQHAAQVAGIDAKDLTSAIMGLQTARSNFALGEPTAVGAWSLLGVDPRQDPFQVIKQLRDQIGSIKDVGIQRNLLGKVGLENLLPLLKSSNAEFEKWSRNFVVNQKQIAQLADLNKAWSSLKGAIVSVKNQFSAVFAPTLQRIAELFEWAAEKVAGFTKWLQIGGAVANVVKWVLIGISIALLIIGVGLALLTAALGAATLAMTAFDLAAAPVIPILAAISAIIVVATAAIAALILLVDDMWHAFTGGKSVLGDLGEIIFGPIFQWLFDMWDAFVEKGKKAIAFFQHPIDSIFSDDAAATSAARGGSATANQQNNVNIKVDGKESPEATGKAVYGAFKTALAVATWQLPVPSF